MTKLNRKSRIVLLTFVMILSLQALAAPAFAAQVFAQFDALTTHIYNTSYSYDQIGNLTSISSAPGDGDVQKLTVRGWNPRAGWGTGPYGF